MPNSSGFSDILKQHLGNEWLAYLRQAGIPYCIRCKENAQIAGKGGTRQALNGHFRALKTGEGRLGPVMLYGQQHYLEATRLTDGQLLVVCSDEEGKGIEAYGERWQIETLFGSLKSKQGVMDKKVFFLRRHVLMDKIGVFRTNSLRNNLL